MKQEKELSELREPYTRPELMTYGDIRQVTEAHDCGAQPPDNTAGCGSSKARTA